jgi:hypothetical protein
MKRVRFAVVLRIPLVYLIIYQSKRGAVRAPKPHASVEFKEKDVTIIELNEVKKTYPLGKVQVEAVKGVTFCIERLFQKSLGSMISGRKRGPFPVG